MLIGAGIIVAGFALGRDLVMLAGLFVIAAAWWLAADTRIRPWRRRS
jgi:hypothetical protein